MRGGLLVLIGNVGQKAATVLFLAVLARWLPLQEFGAFSLAVAYAAFFTVFADIGLDLVTTREIATAPEEDHGEIVGSAIAAKGAAAAVVVLVAAPLALAVYDGVSERAALAGLLVIIASVPTTALLGLAGQIRMTVPVLAQVLGTLGSSAMALALVSWGVSIPLVVLSQGVLTLVVGSVIATATVRHLRIRLAVRRHVVVRLAREAAPLGAATVATVVLARVDQLLLPALHGLAELAVYGAAVRLVDSVNFLPVVTATIGLPALSRDRVVAEERGNRLTEASFRYLAAVILPVAAFGFASGGDVLALVFGEKFREGSDALSVLLAAHYFAFVYVMMRSVLIAWELIRPLAMLTVAAATVNVVLNAILVPRYGAEGAAAASFVSYAIPLAGAASMERTRQFARTAVTASVRPLAASVILLSVLMLLRPNLVFSVVLSMVLAPVALVATGATPLSEIRALARSGMRRGTG